MSPAAATSTNYTYMNTSSNLCCVYNNSVASCATGNTTARLHSTGAAYNGSLDLREAALIPPQFGQILVIVLIVVGILGALAVVGVSAYRKMRG